MKEKLCRIIAQYPDYVVFCSDGKAEQTDIFINGVLFEKISTSDIDNKLAKFVKAGMKCLQFFV